MRFARRRRSSAWIAALAVTAAFAATAPVTGAVAAPTTPQQTAQASTTALTPTQASAQAIATGKAVPVDGATNATDTLTANPDATFTLTRTAVPIRKHTASGWATLDPTLVQAGDGTITTHITTSDLTLSHGGTGPLVTMKSGAQALALSLPMTLPAPTLSGPTATYPAVLPGVDLQVTADAQGGFSDVFVIHDATAAANPALKTLTLATGGTGLSITADEAGNLIAANLEGIAAFTAPTPLMWDSATATQPSTTTGTTDAASPDDDPIDGATGQPIDSSPTGPGEAAHTAAIGVDVTGGDTITLSPDQALLTALDTTYPVYVDPAWQPARGAWASVSEYFPATNYYNNTPDPQGKAQVGNSGAMWSHTLINFPINTGLLSGATIQSAQLSITEVFSYSCTASTVNLYAPSTTLSSSNATWNYWKGVNLGSVVASQTVAHGYNSSCPAAGVGFNVASAITGAVTAGRTTQTFALTGVNEANDHNSWKEFQPSSATLSVTYDHAPNKPTGLTVSPGNSCNNPTVGDGPVSLNAPVSDRDGDTLHVTFSLWRTSDNVAVVNPPATTYPSGSTAVLTVPETTLKAKTPAGTLTQFSWHVQTNDGTLSSGWSNTCTFTFDTTRPGQPDINPTGGTLGQINTQPVTFTIDPPTGTVPSSYLYQLNSGAPNSVVADGAGHASITITPNRFANVLTVTSVSSGQNIGQTRTVLFDSTPANTATDADLTGDSAADLLTVGAVNNLPPGLWQSSGKNTGQVVTASTNIGANGDGLVGDNSPTDFNETQVITGHLNGTGLQDVLIYHPTGSNAGSAVILDGNGDGSALSPDNGNSTPIPAGLLSDNNGLNPIRIVNAGNSGGQNLAYPDLLGIAGDSSIGDYYLDYYPNGNLGTGQVGGYGTVDQLSTPTPTGDMNWNQWTLATTQLTDGSTAMFLWNPTTGALYLWEDLNHPLGTDALSYTPYALSTGGWNTNTALSLEAAAINNDDDTPDLWTVGAGTSGTTVATAYLTTNLASDTGTITPQSGQNLITSTHAWPLNDAGHDDNTPVTNAADTINTAGKLTATTGATWHTGDLYDPDVILNGTTGTLSTSAAVVTTGDYSISAWVKPSTTTGTILSQDGNAGPGFRLWAEPSDASWRFAITSSDSATPTYYTAAAVSHSVQPGVWTQLTATYQHSTGILKLYIDGVSAASTTHTPAWSATGAFQIGDYRTGSNHTGFYAGQIANVQAWQQVIDPTQAATPASYYQTIPATRFLDTRTSAPLGSRGTARIQIAGKNGIPASNITAVALNLTALQETSTGYLAAYPDHTPTPGVSNLYYFNTQTTIANYVIAPVGADGYVDIFNNSTGTTHILVDVTGYFTSDAANAHTYNPLQTSERILDTRNGTGAPTGQLAGGNTLALQVAGAKSDLPATGITAVAINVTVTRSTAGGFLTVYPADGTSRPLTSNVQYTAGQTIADLVIVPVAASNGKINIYSNSTTDVIADVAGYFTAGTTGQKYHAINYTRMIDTRQTDGAVQANGVLGIAQGNTVIAFNPTLILNITATQPTDDGFIVAYPDSTTPPTISNQNWTAGLTISALALPTTNNGTVDIKNASLGSVQLVIDCLGYFSDN